MISIDPLREPSWDEFVHDHPFGWLCHLSHWKRVLEKSFPHLKGHCFAIVESKSGGIRATLPIYEVTSWLTGKRLVSIPFATLCDPLVTQPEDLSRLLDAVVDLSKEAGASYAEVRTLNAHPLFQENCFARRDFFVHHYLPLDAAPEILKKRFHRSCVRQRIDRALQSNLILRLDNDIKALETFFGLYVMTRKRLFLPPQPYKFLHALWKTFAPSGNLQILLAEHDKRAVGGLILFKYRDRVSAEFAASDETFRNFSPNHFLFWEAIKLAYEEGFKIFDFGRTAPDNASLMDFKRRWATTAATLPQFYYPSETVEKIENQGKSIKLKIINQIVQKAPLCSMRMIGNFCYRHLG